MDLSTQLLTVLVTPRNDRPNVKGVRSWVHKWLRAHDINSSMTLWHEQSTYIGEKDWVCVFKITKD